MNRAASSATCNRRPQPRPAAVPVGILLVEHDMDLVMDVCEHVYVLNFGRMLFDGPPPAVRASPPVQSAYLGVEGTRLGSVTP